ncbi:MAG: TolC family protein, partial [Prevotellaceae bacterium]|nr:TolC family protein [Prevotellaceae bacterium]
MKMKIYSFIIAIFFTLSVNAQESTIGIDLQKAIDIALAENPSIRIADKDVKLKEIAKSEAWQQLLPIVSANGQIQHTLLAAEMKLNGNVFKMGQDNTNTAAVVGTVSLPVFAPAIYRTIKLTKQDILLAKEKARASRLDLVNQVTKAFYGLLLAQESRDALQQSYDVSKKNFELVNNKYKVGTV